MEKFQILKMKGLGQEKTCNASHFLRESEPLGEYAWEPFRAKRPQMYDNFPCRKTCGTLLLCLGFLNGLSVCITSCRAKKGGL
jgi:hypothetical protein